MDANRGPRFSLGKIVATAGALTELEESDQQPSDLLIRHQSGDWGDVCPEDALQNDRALSNGTRILSAYRLHSGSWLWIVTEAEDDGGTRSCTTLLLPQEY
jgi:hypothetical protein